MIGLNASNRVPSCITLQHSHNKGVKRIAMPLHASTPPANPDIKRELKEQLLAMSARSFEFFAGDFLV
jgi:hypothetical protein